MSTIDSTTNGDRPATAGSVVPLAPMSDPIAIGQVMARSGLFPDITRVSQAVVKVLAGRELGIGPFAAMSDIHIIEGKPVVGARILAALVRASTTYDYTVVEWSNERCAIDFYRHGQKLEPTVTFSDEDAQRAGLDKPTRTGKPSNHMKFPRNMKFARAMSSGVGLHCPDLTAGTAIYTPDELGIEDPDADIAPVAELDIDDVDEHGPQALAVEPGDEDPARAARAALTDSAIAGGYEAATVVDLCRFYYDQPDLRALQARQAGEMADRLRLAHDTGIDDERLGRLAAKGLAMQDASSARRAADGWLTSRARSAARPGPSA